MTGRGAATVAAVTTGAAAASWLAMNVGPGAALTLVAIVLLLALVARYDNHTGSCLMVTVLALLALGLLCLLLALLVVTGSR